MAYTKTNWVNDTTELSAENMNHIEDGVEKAYGQYLLAVDSVAPEECTTGDKYYNTEDNKIYTATGTDTWGTTGVDAELGIFYVVLESQNIYTYNGATLVSVGGGAGGGDSLPIGTVIAYAGSTATDGFLLANGDAVSRTTYKDLFRIIGTTYGTGDGSTTFNLPNIKGKVVVMFDSNDTAFNILGATGGSKYIQDHRHKYGGTSGGSYAGTVNNTWSNLGSGQGGVTANDTATTTGGVLTTGTGSVSVGNAGNLQPYIILNYIIKVQKTAGEVLSEELPVGAEIDFAGTDDEIPIGWEKVSDFNLTGYILYQNNSGATGNLTLNDNISNYTYYEIIPYGSEMYSLKNRVGTRTIASRQAYDGTYIYNATQTITLTGTSLTQSGIAGWYGPTTNTYQNQSTNDWLSIYQVIGYK